MLQNLSIISIALLLCIALSGCGGGEPTPAPTTADEPAGDIPLLIEE